jgi:hypothetical protein
MLRGESPRRGVASDTVIECRVTNSFIAECTIEHMMATDNGVLYIVSFDGSDRLFPITPTGVFEDVERPKSLVINNDGAIYPSGVEELAEAVGYDEFLDAVQSVTGESVSSIAFNSSADSHTDTDSSGANDSDSDIDGVVWPNRYVTVHVVEGDTGEYCVAERLCSTVDAARDAVSESAFTVGESVHVSVTSNALFSTRIDASSFASDVPSSDVSAVSHAVENHSLLHRHDSLRPLFGVEKWLSRRASTPKYLEPACLELLGAASVFTVLISIMLAIGSDLSTLLSGFPSPAIVAAMWVFVAVFFAGALDWVRSFNDTSSFSLIDPHVARLNTVSESLTTSDTDTVSSEGDDSTMSLPRVSAVNLRVSESVDEVELTGKVNGVEQQWAWMRDTRGVLPAPVRKLMSTTPVHNGVIAVTVREVPGDVSEAESPVLVSESGDWIITE